MDGEAPARLVLSIVKGETSVIEAARKHRWTVTELEITPRRHGHGG
jgi:hypothetical protein